MKDENDVRTLELVAVKPLEANDLLGVLKVEPKLKRLPRQSTYRQPAGAKPVDSSNSFLNVNFVVPVSLVAREWGITARRVRTMLTEGRLSGRQLENGYWEVFYPYRYQFGTRGPAIRRQRNLPPPTRLKKPMSLEQMEAQW